MTAASARPEVPVVRTLRRRADFLRVKAEGQRIGRQGFTLQTLVMPTEPGVALGYTCSKRSFRTGVAANRARRRLKAAWLEVTRETPPPPGWWLVVVGRVPVLEMEFPYLKKDLAAALAELQTKA